MKCSCLKSKQKPTKDLKQNVKKVDLEYFNNTLQNMFKQPVIETYKSEISRLDLFSNNQTDLIKEFRKTSRREDFLSKIYL